MEQPVIQGGPRPQRQVWFRAVAERSDTPATLLAILAMFAVVAALYVARDVFMPIVLAVVLSFLLSPVVRRLNRLGLPNAIGAMVVLVGLLVVVIGGVFTLASPAANWATRLPSISSELERKLWPVKQSVENVKETAERISNMADLDENNGATKVQVEKESLLTRLFTGTRQFIFQAFSVIVLLFFLLAAGDAVISKGVYLIPGIKDRHRIVETARHAERDVSRYLATITLINIGLGVVMGMGLFLAGLPNAGLWGLLIGILNFMPYVGPAVGFVIVAVVSLLTFPELNQVVVALGIYLVIAGLEGQFVTPAIVGRRFSLSPVLIMISLLFWGWMWGVPGLILATPLLVTMHVIHLRLRTDRPLQSDLILQS